jgi:hypothetical protein
VQLPERAISRPFDAIKSRVLNALSPQSGPCELSVRPVRANTSVRTIEARPSVQVRPAGGQRRTVRHRHSMSTGPIGDDQSAFDQPQNAIGFTAFSRKCQDDTMIRCNSVTLKNRTT